MSDPIDERPQTQLYHRRQADAVSDRMVSSRKVCGYPAKDSNISAVKAYKGAIPFTYSGVEFTTDTPESRATRNHPTLAQWYDGDPGVSAPDGNGMVCIDVTWIGKVP